MGSSKLVGTVSGDEIPKIDNAVAVGEDLAFQERWWSLERVLWSVFALIIIGDMLGLFGRGWLAKAEIRGGNLGMNVKYERVERAMTPSILTIDLEPTAIHDGNVKLFVSDSLVRDLGNQRVIPQPEVSTIGNGGITYTFAAQGERARIEFAMEPSFPGFHDFDLQIDGMDRAHKRVLVLP